MRRWFVHQGLHSACITGTVVITWSSPQKISTQQTRKDATPPPPCLHYKVALVKICSNFRSPQHVMQMFSNTSSLIPEFGGFEGTMKQVLAVADIILDQMLGSLKGEVCQDDRVLFVHTLSALYVNLNELVRKSSKDFPAGRTEKGE